MGVKSSTKYSTNAWLGVSTAVGAALFAATGESVWLAVGVAIGAALGSGASVSMRKLNLD